MNIVMQTHTHTNMHTHTHITHTHTSVDIFTIPYCHYRNVSQDFKVFYFYIGSIIHQLIGLQISNIFNVIYTTYHMIRSISAS